MAFQKACRNALEVLAEKYKWTVPSDDETVETLFLWFYQTHYTTFQIMEEDKTLKGVLIASKVLVDMIRFAFIWECEKQIIMKDEKIEEMLKDFEKEKINIDKKFPGWSDNLNKEEQRKQPQSLQIYSI